MLSHHFGHLAPNSQILPTNESAVYSTHLSSTLFQLSSYSTISVHVQTFKKNLSWGQFGTSTCLALLSASDEVLCEHFQIGSMVDQNDG
jgi:hypothetical protein